MITLTSGSYSIELPNPNFSDVLTIAPKTRFYRTMDGTKYSYIRGEKQQQQTLEFTFLTAAKTEEFRTFLLNAVGYPITYTFSGSYWDGYILNDPIEFENLHDGSRLTLELAVTNVTGVTTEPPTTTTSTTTTETPTTTMAPTTTTSSSTTTSTSTTTTAGPTTTTSTTTTYSPGTGYLIMGDNTRITVFDGFSQNIIRSIYYDNTILRGICTDGTNIITCSYNSNGKTVITKYVGLYANISSTFVLTLPGSNASVWGIGWDGTNIIVYDYTHHILYQMDGFSNTILSYLSISSPYIAALGFLGANLMTYRLYGDIIQYTGFSLTSSSSFTPTYSNYSYTVSLMYNGVNLLTYNTGNRYLNLHSGFSDTILSSMQMTTAWFFGTYMEAV